MTLDKVLARMERGEAAAVPPALMPAYIHWLYTTHRCLHTLFRVRVDSVRRGDIVLSFPVTADYTNSGGFLYGGVLAAMADAISLGLIAGMGKSAVTTNLSMNFVKAHPASGRVTLHGAVRHNGGRLLTLRGEILGEAGELLGDMDIAMTVVGRLPEVPEDW